MKDYLDVTELAGDDVSREQVERICNRYYWAGKFCSGKDVLEVACGTGQGLGYIAERSRSFRAGDYSERILKIAREYYGERIDMLQFDAQNIPFPDSTLDIIILFEAIYYIPSAEEFVSQCSRVLRKGGKVLVATANKDLYDFNPSPYSYRYYGTVELKELFESHGFSVEMFGNYPVDKLSLRQQIFRPVKKVASRLGVIPKSMEGKKLLKRLVFGNLVKMPAEVKEGMAPYEDPAAISAAIPDKKHKVIYCVATLS